MLKMCDRNVVKIFKIIVDMIGEKCYNICHQERDNSIYFKVI